MSTTVPLDRVSGLREALANVRDVLAELVEAADEQEAAFAAADLVWLERVTHRQEVLTARLERAERRRLEVLPGGSLRTIARALPGSPDAELRDLVQTIAQSILELRTRQVRNASLLERGAALAGQTVQLLQRLVAEHAQPYGIDGAPVVRQSLVVDGRA